MKRNIKEVEAWLRKALVGLKHRHFLSGGDQIEASLRNDLKYKHY